MLTPEDADALYPIFSDPEVMKYMGRGLPMTREETSESLMTVIGGWDRNGYGRWCVESREDGAVIGCAGLRSLEGTPELVYLLARSHWGRGLATEIGTASLRYGFEEHGFRRIVAITKAENAASRRVMVKLGMTYLGEARYYGYDVVEYAILREEFSSNGEHYSLSRH